MKFQWTTIQVTNLDNSLKFYKDLLGMKISRVIEGGNHQIVMLGEDDDAKIELIPISTASKENLGNGVSIGIAFKQLDDLVEKIKSKNIPVVGPITPMPDIRFFFVNDPDGYTIQLLDE
ncbi:MULTISPECIES: VOC family protein [Terrisporobacter]|uniref:Aldoketomutase n=1 Tax=Terrisporobacter othiniensis TaxID=1577792 RepID=A0A0B3W832_9FIRM|nr:MULTISPECIES: VOC family protein [Terrisporobacter]KHS58572.1 hypothetical protein QX51_02120 [Terrisporobacter othiniensis]MCC3669300.1 VOC family protein [Terrisporobacter mayombei]